MDVHQEIANFIQHEGGVCVFDKFAFPLPYNTDAVACKFGLGAELYMPDIDRMALCDRAARFLLDYWEAFSGYVNRFLADDSRRSVRFLGNPEDRVRADIASVPVLQQGYGCALLGMVDIGIKIDPIDPYRANVVVRRTDQHELSFVDAHFQMCNGQGASNFEVLLAATLRWCATCQPVHGGAGLVYIFETLQDTEYTQQLFKRFPGFDLLDGGAFSRRAGSVHDRIKCVSWLTVLCDRLVEELGGIVKMRAALEPVCKVHHYPGGVVIQAGANPQIGDTWTGDVPEAYRMVARYTKPIRFEAYRNGLFRVPRDLDAKEETLAWIRRFD